MGAAVGAGGDSAPVLEAAEHARDEVAALIEVFVVINGLYPVGSAWDAGLDVEIAQGFAEPVAVIPLVGDQDIGLRQGREDGCAAAIVADLTLGQKQDQRLAIIVADRVQLRVQAAALVRPMRLGTPPC